MIAGVVAWAVSAEIVMGSQRRATNLNAFDSYNFQVKYVRQRKAISISGPSANGCHCH